MFKDLYRTIENLRHCKKKKENYQYIGNFHYTENYKLHNKHIYCHQSTNLNYYINVRNINNTRKEIIMMGQLIFYQN